MYSLFSSERFAKLEMSILYQKFQLVPPESSSTIIPLVTFFFNTLQFLVIKTFMYFVMIVGTTNLFFIQVMHAYLALLFLPFLLLGRNEHIFSVCSGSVDTRDWYQ